MMNAEIRFTVVIPVYNMQQWIGENIAVLKKQTFRHFRCIIGDDLSTDNSLEAIERSMGDDSRFTLVAHKTKKYSLGNISTLIDMSESDDEDIVVLIDGDDQLANENVLQLLAETYAHRQCWMTYGSYAGLHTKIRDLNCNPYPAHIAKQGRFRDVNWCASHLKTFKYGLWKQVKPSALTISEHELKQVKKRALLTGKWRSWYYWRNIQPVELLDESGRFTRRCSDRYITSPMLEMACEKAVFIPDILYYYRTYEKGLNFDVSQKKQKWYQRITRYALIHKERYEKLVV